MRHAPIAACIQHLSIRSFCAKSHRSLRILAIVLTSHTLHLAFLPSHCPSIIRSSKSDFPSSWRVESCLSQIPDQGRRALHRPIIKQFDAAGCRHAKKCPLPKKSCENIGYSDAAQAHFMFCDPKEGRAAREKSTTKLLRTPSSGAFGRRACTGR